MRNWKKNLPRTLVAFFALLCVLLLLPPSAYAADGSESEPDEEIRQQVDELLKESGADDLIPLLPEEGRKLLSENGIDSVSQDALLNLSFGDFLSSIWTGLTSGISLPLTLLLNAVGVILLCALLNSMESSFDSPGFDRVFSTVSVLCLSAVIITPIAKLIVSTAGLIRDLSSFFLGFVPVYVGIVTASGHPVSGMAYNAALIGAAQVTSRLAATVLVPMLAIYLAVCLIGSASKEINMEGIAKTVKTVVVTALTFLLTVFVGLLSVQGVVAASADTVTMRTAKFAVSAFLPVVGGAVSEALNSVQGCLGVVKSTVGGFGIVAIALAFLPTLLSVLMMQLSLTIAAGVSDTLSTSRLSSLLRSASSALSLLLGILLVFAILFIVSLSIMLALSNGG